MTAKPDFSYIYYDKGHICWGVGNDAIGPRLIARIAIPGAKISKKQEKAEKKDYEYAKEVYEKYVNKGVRFKSSGDRATRVEVKITHINFEKQTICWLQDNMTKEEIKKKYKPAKGKFVINSFITLLKHGEIKICE